MRRQAQRAGMTLSIRKNFASQDSSARSRAATIDPEISIMQPN
jgi:hypothetical protein